MERLFPRTQRTLSMLENLRKDIRFIKKIKGLYVKIFLNKKVIKKFSCTQIIYKNFFKKPLTL